MTDEPGCTFEKGEDQVKGNADYRGFQASLDHRFPGVHSGHTSLLSPISLASAQIKPLGMYGADDRARTHNLSSVDLGRASILAPNFAALWRLLTRPAGAARKSTRAPRARW